MFSIFYVYFTFSLIEFFEIMNRIKREIIYDKARQYFRIQRSI